MLLRNYCNARPAAVAILVLTVVFQSSIIWAAPGIPSRKKPVLVAATPSVADIALKSGGVLRGQIVNQARAAIYKASVPKASVPKASVELSSGRQHWRTHTDAQGWFEIANLRGGTYQFRADGQTQSLRLWSPGTAPPGASLGILVLPSTDVVRGQNPVSPNTNQFFRVAKERLANPRVVGGIIATAVAIPVAINNLQDDDTPATP